jgi:glutathione synthase/RimK-type ligase-like ATP-grasp enzyme
VILAVTHAGDDHARPLLDALARRGAEPVVLDLGELPRRGRLTLAYGAGEERLLLLDGQAAIDLRRVSAVWWRRPLPLVAAPGLGPEQAAFAVRQATDAFMGLLASLAPSALLVNEPWRGQVAGQKTLQLAAAPRAGLRLPETLVTSDPAAARAFLARFAEGAVVHKAVHATPADGRLTRRVGPEELANLEALRLAPVILQERVPGVDVRVTVVGERLFAAEIDARATSAADDYRGREAECRIEPCQLPPEVEGPLRALVRELGLRYAAADLRRRDDGAWFFLELNPAGQWGFVEDRTGQPITEALAALLAGGRG